MTPEMDSALARIERLSAERTKAQGELRRALSALEFITDRYISLVNSGDCGFWNPDDEPHVKEARAVLTLSKESTHE